MRVTTVLAFLVMPLFISCATSRSGEAIGSKKEVIRISVNGEERSLLVFYPQEPGRYPLLIAYHGNGGRAVQLHSSTEFEKKWPQAIIVYPQGLPGTDAHDLGGIRTGWQLRPNQNDDRDLLLFDTIVEYFSNKGIVDRQRIYVTGQSMGGAHAFFLWLERSDTIAAFAPCAGQLPPQDIERLPEKPFIMISGRADDVVPFAVQENIYMALTSRFSGTTKMDFYIHNGGHALPIKAPAAIVSFFKEIDAEIVAGK